MPHFLHTVGGVLLSFINDLYSHLFSGLDMLDKINLSEVPIAGGLKELVVASMAVLLSREAERSEIVLFSEVVLCPAL